MRKLKDILTSIKETSTVNNTLKDDEAKQAILNLSLSLSLNEIFNKHVKKGWGKDNQNGDTHEFTVDFTDKEIQQLQDIMSTTERLDQYMKPAQFNSDDVQDINDTGRWLFDLKKKTLTVQELEPFTEWLKFFEKLISRKYPQLYNKLKTSHQEIQQEIKEIENKSEGATFGYYHDCTCDKDFEEYIVKYPLKGKDIQRKEILKDRHVDDNCPVHSNDTINCTCYDDDLSSEGIAGGRMDFGSEDGGSGVTAVDERCPYHGYTARREARDYENEQVWKNTPR